MDKLCPHCKVRKPGTSFYKSRTKKGGLQSWCSDCQKEARKCARVRKRDTEYQRRWRKANPDKRDDYAWAGNIKSKYGLSRTDYSFLLENQNGKCKICGRTEKEAGARRLGVDHCHITGQVRGLLCSRCNRGLGAFEDNSCLLQAAMEYLEEYNR